MSIGHIAVRPHSRAQGHSAAAAVAYRCGLVLTCERTGERHDFTRRAQRDDVAAYGLSGGGFESPAAFAAAVESAEKRRNSRICRDVQIALPAELDAPSRIELAEAFAAELAERYGTAACWAVHRPDRRSDQRNHHAHIILPTRGLAGDGRTFGKKLRVLDDQHRGPLEITEIRQLWETRANEALIAAGQTATVHTGRTTNPEPTLSATHTAIERAAWKRRHPRQNQLPMSAAQLVFDDGICATRRGRALADHVAVCALAVDGAVLPVQRAIRAAGLGPSRPVRPLVPEAAQDLAQAVVPVVSVEEPRPVRALAPEAAQDLAQAVVPVVSVEEPRPVRALAPEAAQDLAQAVVPVVSVEEPRPVRILIRAIIAHLQALMAQRKKLIDARERLRREQDLQAARGGLNGDRPFRNDGHTLRGAADSFARQRLTPNVGLSEHPNLPQAIHYLEPRGATGYEGNALGPVPDSWNVGACRTRTGAVQAANVLEEAIDDIARLHFDGHTDPRDYKPGWFKRSIDDAATAALNAWQKVQEKIVQRMITAAEAPEADEIRRLKHELTLERERKAHAKEDGQRIARDRRAQLAPVPGPMHPNQHTGPGQGF